MPAIKEHWVKENIKFDAIYTGYLGSSKQIDYVADIFAATGTDDCIKIVDPAMADHGKLYRGFDEAFVESMKGLCATADFVIPNITEASLLTGMEYKTQYDRAYIDEILSRLSALGCKNILLTGISYVWVGLLIFIGMMVTHNYSMLKSVTTCLFTIVGIAFIVFVAILFSSLIAKLVMFFVTIAQEIAFHS
jgi:pyridoxal/pyridoxine/pyridoxamine kinase